MSRLVIASWTLSSLGAAAVVIGIGVAPVLGRGTEGRFRHRVLIEFADCPHSTSDDRHDEAGDGHRRAPAPSAHATTQTISVLVPRTALVRLDASGHIAAALTNTGCAPSTLDDVYVVTAAGDVEASATLKVSTIAWTGDFRSPGVYQPQQAARLRAGLWSEESPS
jgi:hypothetical protein